MPDIQLDNPGEIEWLDGHGSATVLGPCPHDCTRLSGRPGGHHHSVIAWGPTTDRYKLVKCAGFGPSGPSGCGCRAWLDGWGNVVSDWLMVSGDPAAVERPARLQATESQS